MYVARRNWVASVPLLHFEDSAKRLVVFKQSSSQAGMNNTLPDFTLSHEPSAEAVTAETVLQGVICLPNHRG